MTLQTVVNFEVYEYKFQVSDPAVGGTYMTLLNTGIQFLRLELSVTWEWFDNNFSMQPRWKLAIDFGFVGGRFANLENLPHARYGSPRGQPVFERYWNAS